MEECLFKWVKSISQWQEPLLSNFVAIGWCSFLIYFCILREPLIHINKSTISWSRTYDKKIQYLKILRVKQTIVLLSYSKIINDELFYLRILSRARVFLKTLSRARVCPRILIRVHVCPKILTRVHVYCSTTNKVLLLRLFYCRWAKSRIKRTCVFPS